MATARRAQLSSLTALRFVAAMGVVVYHYVNIFQPWPVGDDSAVQPHYSSVWTTIIGHGRLGVDFFFVLSGFILAYTYTTPAGGFQGTRRAFWVARIARIYPIYLIGLMLDFVPYLRLEHSWKSIASALFCQPLFLQSWIPALNTASGWNPPSWSLSNEAFFYLLFPFLLPWMSRLSRRGLWTCAVVSCLLFAALPVPFEVIALSRGAAGPWWLTFIPMFNPVMHLPEFVVGAVMGRMYIRTKSTGTPAPNQWQSLGFDVGIVLLALLFIALDVQNLALTQLTAVELPVVVAIIYIFAWQQGVIARMLSMAPLVWLGEVSYAIYILHWPLWAWLALVAPRFLHVSAANIVLLPIYIALLLAVSGLSYQFIERPARRVIRARWQGPVQHAPATVQVPAAVS